MRSGWILYSETISKQHSARNNSESNGIFPIESYKSSWKEAFYCTKSNGNVETSPIRSCDHDRPRSYEIKLTCSLVLA